MIIGEQHEVAKQKKPAQALRRSEVARTTGCTHSGEGQTNVCSPKYNEYRHKDNITMKAMNQVLMEALLDAAAFLELSGDDVVLLDAAVRQLDALSAILGELSDRDKKTFVEFVERRILEEQRGENRSEYLEFLNSFLQDLEDDESNN